MTAYLIVVLPILFVLNTNGRGYVTSPVIQAAKTRAEDSSGCGFEHGHVFLISLMTAQGERGWLLCFDVASQRGWLYSAPRMTELQIVEPQSNVMIKMKSKERLGGMQCIFDGMLYEQNKIQGTLVIGGGPAELKTEKYQVQGYALKRKSAHDERFPGGRYSNVKYLEESGDSVGAELLLYFAEDQTTGLIKFNESYWGEPEFVPLVLSNIHIISSRKLRFELKLEGGVIGKYVAESEKDAVVLSRVDIPSSPDIGPIRMQRQARFLP
jgi:hypothetical protein